jgi:hypothetical protein
MIIEKKRRAPVYISKKGTDKDRQSTRVWSRNRKKFVKFCYFLKDKTASPINTVFQNCLLFNDAILKQTAKHPNQLSLGKFRKSIFRG